MCNRSKLPKLRVEHFAAIRSDGSVVSWGNARSGGGNWAAQYLQRDAWHFEPGIAEGCCDDSSVEDQL